MENHIIKLSKATAELQATCRKLHAEASGLTPDIDAALADDSTDVAALSKQLGNLQSRRFIIKARLLRRQEELYAALLEDARQTQRMAEKEVEESYRAWQTGKLHWSEAVRTAHKKPVAERILGDATLVPNELGKARQRHDIAKAKLHDVVLLRLDIDWEHRQANRRGAAAPMSHQVAAYNWNERDCRRKAAEIIPELNSTPSAIG